MLIKELTQNIIEKIKTIHFIGIGGSGIFPLVQIFLKEGYNIQGSDNNETKNIAFERKLGAKIFIGQSKENIKGADLIIYSAAIQPDNVELKAALESNIPTIERSEVLGFLSRRYNNAICISGTHGKTSTTSMLTQVLFDAKKDPSAILGGFLPSIGGNGRSGDSEIIVIEACEYKDTFLKISPDIAVILNIDNDHMEYFKNMDNLKKSFLDFANSSSSHIVLNADDSHCMDISKKIIDKSKIVYFGLSNDENINYQGKNIKINIDKEHVTTTFDVYKNKEFLTDVILKVPGEHNVLNALAAIVCADLSRVKPSEIKNGLLNFHGAGRRFEILAHHNNITVADDYAHHPTELYVTLETTKKMKFNTVWAIFQPFTFSRTALLLDEFVDALKLADKVLLTPIMGGRETNTYDIYSQDIAKKLDNAKVFDGFEDVKNYAIKNAQPGDLIITLGCGDVDKVATMIKNEYEKM